MEKTTPTFARIAAMVVFALSCFGLLLYLWTSFGGPTPLKPKGYHVQVLVPQASQLAAQADVRISGVPVGRVVDVERAQGNHAKAIVEIDAKYVPLHADARATLRAKTLLGETYVELTPGSRSAPPIPEDGTLPAAQVSPMIALDEIFRAFDSKTRTDLQRWMQASAMGLEGRGRDLNDAFGHLLPFTEDTGRLVSILDRQSGAVEQVVEGTGTVFGTLGERDEQLRTLLRGGRETFDALAERDSELADAFRALPGFERRARAALRQLDAFAAEARPVVRDLRPGVRALAPAFDELARGAPELDGLLKGVDALSRASKTGFPAAVRSIGRLRPLLAELSPALDNLNPFLEVVSGYNRELEAFVGNTTAASQASVTTASGPLHYLRTMAPMRPESLAGFPRQTGASRGSPYPRPGSLDAFGRLETYDDRNCARGNPVFAGEPAGAVTSELLDLLQGVGVLRRGAPGESTDVAAPPCLKQTLTFPHVSESG
jgi:virulence factor Mce-like protein